ncbi:MAG TPA: nuclear transport factor 2 family protein, partial [Alphaproteobacteria bacterium]|nr:nuclear transport factor 2 family protein [Alphaproteobacteria bacterium]
MTAPLDRYAAFWETLTPDGVEALDAVAAPDFRFVDPFNDVAGRAAVKGILRHMFETLEVARFAVTDRAMGQGAGFLKWTFDYRVRGRAIAGTIVGVSEVRF